MCSEENNWVYTTSYWSGSAYDFAVWSVGTDGGFYVDYCDTNDYYGVRPVVNISVSEIK